MTAHFRRMVALTAAALLLAVPARGQDVTTTVSFGDVSFTFDDQLASSVATVQVANLPAVRGPGGPQVAHLAFSLSHTSREGFSVPGTFRADGAVRAYRTADLEGTKDESKQLEQLRALLSERPDLSTYMVVTPGTEHQPLPYLPIADAAQVLRARAQYVDTPQLSGVSYVAGFRQDVARFAAGDFRYTFQGLSTDGSWYLTVDWVLTAQGFPKTVHFVRSDTQGAGWAKYLNRAIKKLNALGPEGFTPPLTSLDALVPSITIEDSQVVQPPSSPSPVTSPLPSPVA